MEVTASTDNSNSYALAFYCFDINARSWDSNFLINLLLFYFINICSVIQLDLIYI